MLRHTWPQSTANFNRRMMAVWRGGAAYGSQTHQLIGCWCKSKTRRMYRKHGHLEAVCWVDSSQNKGDVKGSTGRSKGGGKGKKGRKCNTSLYAKIEAKTQCLVHKTEDCLHKTLTRQNCGDFCLLRAESRGASVREVHDELSNCFRGRMLLCAAMRNRQWLHEWDWGWYEGLGKLKLTRLTDAHVMSQHVWEAEAGVDRAEVERWTIWAHQVWFLWKGSSCRTVCSFAQRCRWTLAGVFWARHGCAHRTARSWLNWVASSGIKMWTMGTCRLSPRLLRNESWRRFDVSWGTSRQDSTRTRIGGLTR